MIWSDIALNLSLNLIADSYRLLQGGSRVKVQVADCQRSYCSEDRIPQL